MSIYEYNGVRPRIGENVFLAPGVVVLGDVEIGEGSNLWFYTVVRGDVYPIKIGRKTNIQDHCMLHVTGGRFPLIIGDGVIVGHRAVLHGCTVHDNALIGIGALVLDGSVVEEGAIVAAGAVVTPGSTVPIQPRGRRYPRSRHTGTHCGREDLPSTKPRQIPRIRPTFPRTGPAAVRKSPSAHF